MTVVRETSHTTDVAAGLLHLVRAHAVHRPDALAVADAEGSLTYRQLVGRAAALAAQLRSSGTRPGDPVGLCLPRSCDLVVGALAVLAAGGGYVALDPAQPDERVQYMLADAGARTALARPADHERLPGVATLDPAAVGEDGGDPATWPTPTDDSAAYIIYTSGSTGTPKGVVVEHASVLNLVAWHNRAFGVGPDDRCTLLASPGFDASVWEIWPCLVAGASLHAPAESLKTDPAGLRDWLLAEGITVSFVPTPLAETLLALDWPDTAPLRYLLTGGDRLVRRPGRNLPFTLVNNYGVSEAAVVSTSGVVEPSADAGSPGSAPTLGAAIDGVHLTVLGEDGGDGTVGELVISGVSVARGYVNPPAGAGPFHVDDHGARRYHTGDLVRLRTDGQLEYLGRMDDQVQIRGFRIEVGEISTVIDHHRAVRASAVVPVGAEGSAQALRAFVVWDTDADEDGLRRHLATQLPQHMVPTDIVTVTELPTMANGKVDRSALLAWVPPRPDDGPDAAPRTDLEATIAAMVAERLGVPTVGVEENFFLLGGHSMLGAQLVTRIGQQFGIEMSLRALFEHPTVAGIAEEVERLLIADIAAMDDDELLAAAARLDEEGHGA